MGRIKHQHRLGDIGFQIAPMIDVVFVIMLFFMVKVGARQTETEIKSKLPSHAETLVPPPGLELLEETITIDENGVIAHNEEMLEAGNVKGSDLVELKGRMKRLTEQAKSNKTEVFVTISTQPDTKYSRLVDVLNALQLAGIKNMTFTFGDEAMVASPDKGEREVVKSPLIPKAGEQSKQDGRMMMRIKWNAGLKKSLLALDGVIYKNVEELKTAMEARKLKGLNLELLICGDLNLPAREVQKAMQAAGAAGIDSISFSTFNQ